MQTPTVSVILTTYNIEDYIYKCVSSLQKQSFNDFELIVVDDGSTDNTLARLERHYRYGKYNYTIIALPENTPGGVGIPANIGVSAAKGKYIAYADGDDWYEPTMLEDLVTEAESTEADIVIANFRNYDDLNKTVEIPTDDKRLSALAAMPRDTMTEVEFKSEVLRLNAVPWRKLYRAEFLAQNSIAFPEGNFFFEDNPYHWASVIKARRIGFVDKVICHHRFNRPGQTMASTGRELLWFYDHYWTIKNWLDAEGLDNDYGLQLLAWAVGQTDWISDRIQTEYWLELFDRLHDIFAPISKEDAARALVMRGTGRFGWNLVSSVHAGDKMAFAHAIRFRDQDVSRRLKQALDELDILKRRVGEIARRMEVNDKITSAAALMEMVEKRSR
ncbi:glycosyltransferase [Rhizobium sp. TRM96647]|uniref:glycosyltransferase family 2 protein n=1 Tax=unclassified Rhizobium TaxID=2613769 RepID=UPI0021E9AD41|nr:MULTISPECIES: glycosyltransferase family 2 protein [unclassified Rhizobium]MCV3736650.1 glycosyltransferase [Rhizobium sp. TRM96647]MCV3759019.1 glycosyltransferase [Rhizobium sp. TRM96650]